MFAFSVNYGSKFSIFLCS